MNNKLQGSEDSRLAQMLEYANTLTRSSPDGVIAVDIDLRITEWNLLMEQMCGKSREQEIGQYLEDIPFMKETGEGARIKEGLEGKSIGPREVAYRIPGEDTERFFESIMAPLRGPTGEILGAVLRIRDITERKRMANESIESEHRLRTILESVQAGIVIIDPALHKIVDVNPFAARMIGSPKENIVGAECHKFICPAERNQCPFTDLHQTIDNSESTLLTASGERREILKTVTIIQLGGKPHLLESFIDITERRQAEQALRQSEEKFHAMSASAQDAIIMIDHAGNISFWNTAAEKIFGYSSQEVLGNNLHTLIAPDRFLEAHRKGFEHFQQTGEGAAVGKTLELIAQHRDGSEFPVELSLSAVSIGNQWHTLGIFRDITERKQAVLALQENERKYRGLFEGSRDALMVARPPSWHFTEVNQAALQLFGAVSEADFAALGPWDLSPERQPDGRLSKEKGQELGVIVLREGSCLFEWQLRRLNGETFTASVLGTRMGPRGQTYLQASVRDISERKQAQQALSDSEELLRTVFDSVQDGIIVADAQTRQFRMVNASICRMLGYHRDELLRLGLEGIHPAEELAYVSSQFERLGKGEIGIAPSLPMKRKDGSIFYADVNAGPMMINGVASLVGVFRDITERMRAEEQQRQALLYARGLIEADMDPLVTINVAGKIMDVNEAAIQMTGVPRELLIGSDFSTYFTDPDRAHAGYQEAFAKGFVRDYPLTMRHVSGALTEVLYNASVYRNEKGEMAGVLAVARDITERLRAEQAEEQASRDGLTELYNHRMFYALLKDEIFRTQRSNRLLSLLMLDIDYFKRVNDTHGHQAGDVILKGISDLLVKQARAVDRVCRYGGEEIAVILPETDAPEAMKIAERLCAAVELHSFDIGGGKTASITVSIGVATYPQQANSLEALVKAADVALYAAKQGGRNRVCRYETEMAGVNRPSPGS